VQEEIPLLPKTQEAKQTRQVPLPTLSDPTAVTIELSRSGCFGTCPVYSVTLRGDGLVTYRGKDFVSIPGYRTAHVDGAAVSALMDRFRAANFLALQREYRARMTDQPTFLLTFRMGDVVNVVSDYAGAWVGMPTVVTELEEAVDQVSDS